MGEVSIISSVRKGVVVFFYLRGPIATSSALHFRVESAKSNIILGNVPHVLTYTIFYSRVANDYRGGGSSTSSRDERGDRLGVGSTGRRVFAPL